MKSDVIPLTGSWLLTDVECGRGRGHVGPDRQPVPGAIPSETVCKGRNPLTGEGRRGAPSWTGRV